MRNRIFENWEQEVLTKCIGGSCQVWLHCKKCEEQWQVWLRLDKSHSAPFWLQNPKDGDCFRCGDEHVILHVQATLDQYVKIDNLEDMQAAVENWAYSALGIDKIDPDSVIKHIKKEIKELEKSQSPEEAADILILLLNYAAAKKFSLWQEMIKKHQINQKRSWKLGKDGCYHHIPE